jgi:tRNA pseudouridine55 synthase
MTISGFLLVDKPAGITSHDVIDRLRRVTGEKRIGHAGTLDPFATGLLIVAVGREATKEISNYVGMDKTYEAEFVLGATTETLDPEGVVVVANPGISPLDPTTIAAAMARLTGEIQQVPPMHSAIKKGGKKMYELARQGQTVELTPRTITIYEFELLDSDADAIRVRIRCSSGTYIRALARDLAAELGTQGYVRQLRRTAIGSANIEQAAKLGDITSENWQILLKKAV